jgi:hypothetical protein
MLASSRLLQLLLMLIGPRLEPGLGRIAWRTISLLFHILKSQLSLS